MFTTLQGKATDQAFYQYVLILDFGALLLADPEHSQGISPRIFDLTPVV